MYVCMFLEKMLDDRECLCICSIGIYQNWQIKKGVALKSAHYGPFLTSVTKTSFCDKMDKIALLRWVENQKVFYLLMLYPKTRN